MRGIRIFCVVALAALAGTPLLAMRAVAAPADDARSCNGDSGDVALAACTRAIASGRYTGHGLAGLYANRGVEYAAKNDDDRAFSDYGVAIRLDPKEARTFYNRANLHARRNDHDRALADYGEAIRLNPKYGKALNNRGDEYRIMKDYDRALADFAAAIALDPKHRSAVLNRGIVYFVTGKYDLAIVDFDDCVRLDSKFGDGLYGRGLAKLRTGDIAGGNDDIAAAKQVETGIAQRWARDFEIAAP